jgi:hypothetical protein
MVRNTIRPNRHQPMPSLKQLLAILTVCSSTAVAWKEGFEAAPQQFRQEIVRSFNGAPTAPAGEIQLLYPAADGTIRAFHGGTWSEYRGDRWTPLPALTPKSAGEFVFPDNAGKPVTVNLPWRSIRQITRAAQDLWLVASDTPYVVQDGVLTPQAWPSNLKANQVATGPGGEIVVASSGGLMRKTGGGWEAIQILDEGGRAWAVRDVLGTAFDTNGRLWFATKAGVGCRTSQTWHFYEGKDGLPWNDFTGVFPGADGTAWFATRLGAICWDGTGFQYRQGPRWLPSDDVRQIAIDRDGRAWFGTAQGVGQIEHRPMTLAAKAEYYENEIETYIKRTPFGFTAEAPLKKAADKSSASPEDSDNDGLWTAMYGAGESFAYGATHDPKAKDRATKAFEALRFLQKVTQGGNPSPPKGYVARTIRPTEWPDPNTGRIERDREDAKGDALWKVYEPRWPKSADGKWYWKSDTSSDELDGHYFLYASYFDLVAETAAEKERVREVVRDLTDHLVSHDFSLIDVDGKPTRWGVYGPKSMNGDGRWWAERGLNSLSILSYLAVAAHITGDSKYNDIARELVTKHGYAQNLLFPKVQFGPGSGNQSDDEMAVMCFYNLLKYGKDPEIIDRVRYSFFAYWAMEEPEMNPFFNFTFAVHGLEKSVRNVWGEFSVNPWKGWFEDSMATLRGFPLDRLNWPHKNSHRLDITFLSPQKSKDLYEPRNGGRGHRPNGKVVPVENRHFEHWNTDPWTLDYGGSGDMLGSGTVYLLPYYFGMYHGFIAKP